jgi:hypothetical protein
MLINTEVTGLWELLSYQERASVCEHHISWSVYRRAGQGRTQRERRFYSSPRFMLCAVCTARVWAERARGEGDQALEDDAQEAIPLPKVGGDVFV